MKTVDEKYQVSEEDSGLPSLLLKRRLPSQGLLFTKNHYILTGATWVTRAFLRVQKVASEVSQKAKEKLKASAMESEQRSSSPVHEDHNSSFSDGYGPRPSSPATDRSSCPVLGY